MDGARSKDEPKPRIVKIVNPDDYDDVVVQFSFHRTYRFHGFMTKSGFVVTQVSETHE